MRRRPPDARCRPRGPRTWTRHSSSRWRPTACPWPWTRRVRPRAPRSSAAGRRSIGVGERNHACADCHTPDHGANKFLGGRFLGDVTGGLTRHSPTWRTSQNDVWDMRKRMQWCMTPLGANMLAADAVEYAELELYLTTFDVGKPINAPGIRH